MCVATWRKKRGSCGVCCSGTFTCDVSGYVNATWVHGGLCALEKVWARMPFQDILMSNGNYLQGYGIATMLWDCDYAFPEPFEKSRGLSNGYGVATTAFPEPSEKSCGLFAGLWDCANDCCCVWRANLGGKRALGLYRIGFRVNPMQNIPLPTALMLLSNPFQSTRPVCWAAPVCR